MALAINRKYSLAEVGDGWEDCFMLYRPSTYDDIKAMSKIDKTNIEGAQNIDIMYKFIKDHFRGGKVLKDLDGAAALADMSKEDVHELPRKVIDDLAEEIMGRDLDPKGEEPTDGTSSTTTNRSTTTTSEK